MKKVIILTVVGLAAISAGVYLKAMNLLELLFPTQHTVLQVDENRCDISLLPALPEVTLLDASLEDEQAQHCRIFGRIDNEIHFELLLPDAWNGKFVMGGGGGFAGSIVNMAKLYGALRSGYATVGTDTGHAAHSIDGSWALDNPERLENFGHRAVHLTAATAKSLLAEYYQRESTNNYFLGCSRGGGQALMEAQRYPEDFDGIVAGAPAYNWPYLAANGVQINQKMFPDQNQLEEAIVGPGEQAIIAQHYLAQCDGLDGLEDGILTDPRQCQFDVQALRCKQENSGACLSAEQVDAMQQVYRGPSDAEGQLYPGFPLGGETSDGGMTFWVAGGTRHNPDISSPRPPDTHSAPVMPNAIYGFSTGIMKYMVFNDPDWDYSTYDFNNFREDSAHAATILNATDPDLAAFRSRGGKLLIYHGWSDMALSALGTIEYFDKVMNYDPEAAEDVLLYLLPGVDHCFGGAGPSLVNYLTVIDQWITSGIKPGPLTAQWLKWNILPSGSRLICPHPQYALYQGAGDSDQADSFRCVDPQ